MSRAGKIKVIDLFAGPGGLGEGFAAFNNGSGKHPFKLSLSIEKDPSAYNTLLLRSFFRQFGSDYIPDNYWHYLKGGITREDLFRLHPKQAAAAFAEAKCIELGKTPRNDVKELIDQRLTCTTIGKVFTIIGYQYFSYS